MSMLIRTLSFTALSLAAVVVRSASAEESSPPPRSAPAAALLRNPQALGGWLMRRSHEVAAAKALLDQARAGSHASRLLPNPVVDFTVSNYPLGTSTPPGLGLNRTLIYSAGVSELVELGKRGPRAEAADLRADAAAKRVDVALADRIADARAALAGAIYTGARRQTLDESLTAAQASADVAKGRLEHQALAGVDYDRLLLDLASLEVDAARARADADAASSACASVLLAPCDLSGASLNELDGAVPVPSALPADLLERRSDVAALRLEGQAAQRDATLASRRAIPDVTLRLGYVHDDFTVSGDNANTLGLTLTFPIPASDRGQHDQAAALARARELEQNAQGIVASARGDLAGLAARRASLEGTLRSLERDVVPRATTVLAASEKGLREGQLDMTDLLLARRQAIAVRLQVLDIRFELFTVKNAIRRALGLDESSGKNEAMAQ